MTAGLGKRRAAASGQATVEAVFGLLLVTGLIAGAMQLAFAGYAIQAANSAVQAASWNVDASELLAAADKDAVVQRAITSSVPGAEAGDVKVTNATASRRSATDGDPHVDTGGGSMSIRTGKTVVQLECDVEFTAPVANGIVLRRHVSHALTTAQEAEVA